jgi:hypothetical protein
MSRGAEKWVQNFWMEILKGREHSEGLCVDRNKILKRILRK